jgi:GNAT superfamily N-acetyltransferase
MSPSLSEAVGNRVIVDDAQNPETEAAWPTGMRIARVGRAHAPALMALCAEHAAESAFERRAYGPANGNVLELMEALFEPPLRAWAWLAERDGEAVGYASVTAGFSMLERAYYLNLEALFVRADARPSGAVAALLAQARRAAEELGCSNLRWQVPVGRAAPAQIELPGHPAAIGVIQYVFPTAASADAHG